VAHEALLNGPWAIPVDAWKTSQACPRCGYTWAENQPEKGLQFGCQRPDCQLVLHADPMGARNIALRTSLGRRPRKTGRARGSCQNAMEGLLAILTCRTRMPKLCVQRQRSAEVRWSPDTRSRL
jgi:hypothetical protein